MDKALTKKKYRHAIYPISKPREEGYLKVSSLHTLYYAQYGNPDGIPVVILHGGPGAGCEAAHSSFFDLNRWNVIMFDQRGAMRSKPFGCMEDNTPQHSIKDIEKLRKHFGIKKWLIFGGSYGTALSLLYGQAHPKRCLGFIVRGIFLARKEDYFYLFYDLGKIYPKIFKPCLEHIPKKERSDLIGAYYRRIMDPNSAIHQPAAEALLSFIAACWKTPPNRHHESLKRKLKKEELLKSCSRAFIHYCMHGFFLKPNQILANMGKIAHLPGIIIQGRLDGINPPAVASLLHKKWQNSALWMIPKEGHSAHDPAISLALATATDLFADYLN